MSAVEQFPYCDRNPASGGLDLMPDLPIILRHRSRSLSGVGLIDSGASVSVLPFSLGVQLGFDWSSEKSPITLGGILAHVEARGIVVEAAVGPLSPVRLALAWANTDQVPFLLGQFNFFRAFDVCFLSTVGLFEIRLPGAANLP